MGYNFTFKVWYILSAEEIKRQSLSSARVSFSKPFTKEHPFTGAFFIQESEDEMGVRVVFPDMGKDPSIQLIEKTITQNGTYDAITDGANGYSKVNVNVEGGGGSSDFSTAEVSILNGGSSPETSPLEFIAVDRDQLTLMRVSEGGVYECVLYKNKCLINTTTDTFVSCEGNVSFKIDDTDVYITVTGDCTITIKFPSLIN